MDIAALHSLDAPPRDRLRTDLVERPAAGPGHMSPLHTRDETEAYHLLAGALTLFVGSETVSLEAGETAIVPADVPRTVRVESEGTRWLVATRTAAPAYFEHFGLALAAPAPDQATDDLAALAALVSAAGIDVLGPPGALPADVAFV